jgi:drug/metabolite transporter (DMT)-like permease
MNWVFFALLAPALDSVINFTDKYIVEKEVQDYRGMPIYTALVSVIAGTLYWIFTGFPKLNTHDAGIILLTGVLTIWGLALYFKALMIEETSRIIMFFKAIPIFILIFSWIFLKEGISLIQCAGFIVIFTAVIGVSYEKKDNDTGSLLSPGLLLILLADILWAIAAILAKFAITLVSFSSILSYESWGVGIGGALLFLGVPSIRKAFLQTTKSIRKTAFVIMMVNETIFIISRAITFYAYSLGPTALVSVIGGTQVFYGIVYGVALSHIAPDTFREDSSRSGLLRKLCFSALLVLGIYLVAYG